MEETPTLETDLSVGPRSIEAFSRLSYSMWYALAEFIDNSTQSRLNYESIIDDVLREEGQPLVVQILHNRTEKTLTIEDNSIGMTKDDLINALKIAHPTVDSRGRSKYGMGMKTAACWIGKRWQVITAEWGSGEEWTAEVDVEGIAHHGKRVQLRHREVAKDQHYTKIAISDLNRMIQKRTEETIKNYLGSMYRFDLEDKRLKILYNGDEVPTPDALDFDTDPEGHLMRRDLPEVYINGKRVKGWIAVLRKGGRKFGGFSLFQERRQIQGFPHAWKPRRIFGGVDDEGANNLISQRLAGVIELDGFQVSHTKDAILFEGNEEEELEELLFEQTRDYCNYATRRRGRQGEPWAREKLHDLVTELRTEFATPEMHDAIVSTLLPPLETILQNKQQQVESLTEAERVGEIPITPDLTIVVSWQTRSEYEPHLTIAAGADDGKVHVILNALHPYYCGLESADAVSECVRQYIYDAAAEHRVANQMARVNPDSVRRHKSDLLRAQVLRIENASAATRDQAAPQE